MKFSAPKKATWWIATIIALVSLADRLVNLPVLHFKYHYLILAIAFALLWLGTFVKGL